MKRLFAALAGFSLLVVLACDAPTPTPTATPTPIPLTGTQILAMSRERMAEVETLRGEVSARMQRGDVAYLFKLEADVEFPERAHGTFEFGGEQWEFMWFGDEYYEAYLPGGRFYRADTAMVEQLRSLWQPTAEEPFTDLVRQPDQTIAGSAFYHITFHMDMVEFIERLTEEERPGVELKGRGELLIDQESLLPHGFTLSCKGCFLRLGADMDLTLDAILSQFNEPARIPPKPTATPPPTPTPYPTYTPLPTYTPYPTPVPTTTPTSVPIPTSTPSLGEIIKQVRGAVVRIETPDGKWIGSGTIISSDGYILTNFHVVEGYSTANVLVQDIYTSRGNVVGYDEGLDLAIVKISGGPWPYLEVTEYRPQVGEEVMMIGYALDLPGQASVTQGIVSAIRPGTRLTWIQTDAAANPGISGGAAVNSAGQFIGVPTWGYTEAENVGFFIGLFSVADAIPRLINGDRVKLPTATPVPTGNWRVATTSNGLIATLDATYGTSKGGDPFYLVIRCSNRVTDFYIDWRMFISSGDPLVTHQIGSARSETTVWIISTSYQATFFPGSPIGFINQLVMSADYLVAKVIPYGQSAIVGGWDLTGIGLAVQPVREACGW